MSDIVDVIEDTKMKEIEDLNRQIIEDKCALESRESSVGDWKVIKIYEARIEGRPDPYDATELIAARKAIRKRINDNQARIAALEAE